MEPRPIAHIGVLVADVEPARKHWANALGRPFSPIVRYRSNSWSDFADPAPHANDLRQTIYVGTDPSIEVQEFVNNGTHSASRGEGGHHIGFPPVADNNARRRELADIGVRMDGQVNHDGRWIIQFTDARALNNVATEWVEASPGHLDLKDDGSPVDRLPDGSTTVFDAEAINAVGPERPVSGIVDVGVLVSDLPAAVRIWSAVTGYEFEMLESPESSAVSRGTIPAVRLVEVSVGPVREGLKYAVVETESTEATRARLRRSGVPLSVDVVVPDEVEIDPVYLNGFSLRFRRRPE